VTAKMTTTLAGLAYSQWSGHKAPPAIGERVTVSFNELGAGEVIGYQVTDDFLGVWLKLDKSPAWRVKQGRGDDVPALIYGAELLEQRPDYVAPVPAPQVTE
jgi:hypothetical protein